MGRLTVFELQKIWHKRSFKFSVCVLLLLNIFFLWYTSLGNDRTPELSSYKMFAADTCKMTEQEKDAFVAELKGKIDGVSFVAGILSMQNSEIGARFAEQEMAGKPGVFEKYYDLYQSGNYLRYTNSLELEKLFISEIYAEETRVSNYTSYLESIQSRKDSLNGISVFASQNKDTFAARNIQKSAEDYKALLADGIKWSPSKTITSTMENVWTDILLILLSFLFVGSLITEEKQKGLFYITRSTKYGMGVSIVSKLSALLVHCVAVSAILYLSNYLYFGFTAGWCDLTAKIQSLAPYMESALPINILEFMVLSVLTKALVLFGVGAVLIAFCILSENMVLPYFAGFVFWAISWLLYRFVPAASKFSAVKYINIFGALRAENLYGAYLNLNIGEFPFSRTFLTWIIIAIVAIAGIIFSYLFFLKGEKLQLKKTAKHFLFRFRPHVSLLRHEGYKILFSNHGLAILLLFCILIGYNTFHRTYYPTTQEQYYQNIMLQLEGALTEEKAALIESEAARYQEAFAEIEKIDQMVAANKIDQEVAETMKIKWNSVTAFYPAFQRVEGQLELVQKNGSCFIYDTGYLYLLGVLDENRMSDFLLLTLGIILAFSNVISVEYQTGAWKLLCAATKGKKGILREKTVVCSLAAGLFSVVPFVCRLINIARTFPIHGLFYSGQSIPFYQNMPRFMPVIALLVLKLLIQVATGLLLTFAVMLLSGWRKSHVQTMFFGFLLLCAPVILAVLGFTFAQYLSLYPIYTCTL